MFCGEGAVITNRNKVRSSCSALESSPNQSLVPDCWLGSAVLEYAFQCLGFLEFAGPAFSRCVPYHNMEDAGLNICVCVCLCIYIYIFVCLCLMAHIETICLETLIPFRLVFLFKASFMFLVCIICHRTFPFVFNDDPSYCKMSGCESFFPWLCFLSSVLHV